VGAVAREPDPTETALREWVKRPAPITPTADWPDDGRARGARPAPTDLQNGGEQVIDARPCLEQVQHAKEILDELHLKRVSGGRIENGHGQLGQLPTLEPLPDADEHRQGPPGAIVVDAVESRADELVHPR
jgi:hypothetical protein